MGKCENISAGFLVILVLFMVVTLITHASIMGDLIGNEELYVKEEHITYDAETGKANPTITYDHLWQNTEELKDTLHLNEAGIDKIDKVMGWTFFAGGSITAFCAGMYALGMSQLREDLAIGKEEEHDAFGAMFIVADFFCADDDCHRLGVVVMWVQFFAMLLAFTIGCATGNMQTGLLVTVAIPLVVTPGWKLCWALHAKWVSSKVVIPKEVDDGTASTIKRRLACTPQFAKLLREHPEKLGKHNL